MGVGRLTAGFASTIGFASLPRAVVGVLLLLTGCNSTENAGPLPRGAAIPASITFTTVPEAVQGGSARMEAIEGRVTGAAAGQQIVLYARSGIWWIQPFAAKPLTEIRKDSTFRATTHMGTEYTALLVEPRYSPPSTVETLPARGGSVVAVATVKGKSPIPETLNFSGYEWEVRKVPDDRNATAQADHGASAWTDRKGRLHLRITHESRDWVGADVNLRRSLGYGSYIFTVSEITPVEPATVLGMFTWPEEIDVELSQWGDPAAKNTQFVIQPYYVPANVFRFISPPVTLNHSFRWEPGRARHLPRAGRRRRYTWCTLPEEARRQRC